MIGRRRLFHLAELTVTSKPKSAALFDKESYTTTVLYFEDEDAARKYAKRNFAADDFKIRNRLAVGDNEKYTIMDPKQELKLTNDNSNYTIVNAKKYRVCLSDKVRYAGIEALTSYIYYMQATPIYDEHAGQGFFTKKFRKNEKAKKEEVGLELHHTPLLKDATHFLFTYQAGEGRPMIAVLAEPRKEEVTLTSSKRNTADVSHPCKGRK